MYKFIGFVDADYKYEHEPLPDDAKLIEMEGLNTKSFIAGFVGIIMCYEGNTDEFETAIDR